MILSDILSRIQNSMPGSDFSAKPDRTMETWQPACRSTYLFDMLLQALRDTVRIARVISRNGGQGNNFMAGISGQVLERIPPVLDHPLFLLLVGHGARVFNGEI